MVVLLLVPSTVIGVIALTSIALGRGVPLWSRVAVVLSNRLSISLILLSMVLDSMGGDGSSGLALRGIGLVLAAAFIGVASLFPSQFNVDIAEELLEGYPSDYVRRVRLVVLAGWVVLLCGCGVALILLADRLG